MIFRRHAETLGAFSPASTAASFPPRPGGRVSTALFLANRTLQGTRDAAGCLTWRRWEAEVLVGVAGTEWPSHSTAGLLKPPPCARNTIPGPDDSHVYLKSVSMGRAKIKSRHPLEEGNQSAHTGTLVVHFGAALGLAGSNKMLSVPPHRRDQDGSAEGGATRLGTIGYRAKANACPGLAAWT